MMNTYQEILEYYLNNSINTCAIKSNPVVLKTDLFNEAHSKPKKGGIIGNLKNCKYIVGMEYQENVVQLAREQIGNKHHTLMQGDIRKLPFRDKSFDVILDLSTIDHVMPSEVDGVLAGYNRILADKGAMFLVVWTGDENSQDWNPNNQYYFEKEKFEDTLKKYFTVIVKELVFTDPTNSKKQLFSYLCTVWHGNTY